MEFVTFWPLFSVAVGILAHESVSCDSGDLSTQRYITVNDDVKGRAIELV